MLEDDDYLEPWGREFYSVVIDKFSTKGIIEQNIWSNGYQYIVRHKEYEMSFFIQTLGYNGGARMFGNVYKVNKFEEKTKIECEKIMVYAPDIVDKLILALEAYID